MPYESICVVSWQPMTCLSTRSRPGPGVRTSHAWKNGALLVPLRMYTTGMRLWSRCMLQMSEDVVGADGDGELSFSATCRVENIASVLE